jgi:hypothetical protein
LKYIVGVTENKLNEAKVEIEKVGKVTTSSEHQQHC